MKVKGAMNKAIAVEHNITLHEAADIMSHKNIGSLIAVKKGQILGIVTERDVMKNLSKLDSKIGTVMARKVVTINEDSDLDEAALLMAKNKIRRLPVTRNGELVGMITSTDLIAHSEEISEEFLFD